MMRRNNWAFFMAIATIIAMLMTGCVGPNGEDPTAPCEPVETLCMVENTPSATEPVTKNEIVVEIATPAKPIDPETNHEPESIAEEEAGEEAPSVDPVSLELLACVIYQEAGGDACCDNCRRRVGDVVLNRVEDPRFPNTIYGVLTQKRQYGLFYKTGVVWPARAKEPGEADAVARAYRIAEEILLGKHSDLYGNGYIWQAEFKQGTGIVKCCGIYYGK